MPVAAYTAVVHPDTRAGVLYTYRHPEQDIAAVACRKTPDHAPCPCSENKPDLILCGFSCIKIRLPYKEV